MIPQAVSKRRNFASVVVESVDKLAKCQSRNPCHAGIYFDFRLLFFSYTSGCDDLQTSQRIQELRALFSMSGCRRHSFIDACESRHCPSAGSIVFRNCMSHNVIINATKTPNRCLLLCISRCSRAHYLWRGIIGGAAGGVHEIRHIIP